MEQIQRQMNNMFEDSLGRAGRDSGAVNSQMDVKSTYSQYVYKMDMPGMDKDKINVEVNNNMLTVSGEKKSEVEEKTPNKIRQEKNIGSFVRSMSLPADAIPNKPIQK